MLTSVLPGVRELRAPLAAGYLWLLALYIALEPLVPGQAQATGVWGSLLKLEAVASPVGLGVAITFVAYLVGSISESVMIASSLPVIRRWPRLTRRLGMWSPGLSPQLATTLEELVAARLAPVRAAMGELGTSLERLVTLEDERLPHERAPSGAELALANLVWSSMPAWRTLAQHAAESASGEGPGEEAA